MEDDKLELTPRALAIAEGRDPDNLPQDPPADDAVQPAETVASEQTTATDGNEVGGTEAARSPAAEQTWLTDAHRELGASYGFSEEDLREFGSPAEFERAARMYDRQLAALARQPAEGVDRGGPPRTGSPKTTAQPEPAKAPPAAADKIELDPEAYAKEGYDEHTLKLVKFAKQLHERFEAQAAEMADLKALKPLIEQQRQFQEAQAAQSRIEAFHDAVDALADGSFGKSLDEHGNPLPLSPEADGRRRKLFEAMRTIEGGIAARAAALGIEPQMPSQATLVRRAKAMAFAEEIAAAERKKLHAQVLDQSKRRRGVEASRPVTAPVAKEPRSLQEQALAISADPEVTALFRKFQQANGAA